MLEYYYIMYNYRLKETTTWVDKLISTHESGTIIGLPKSGATKTLLYVLSQNELEDHHLYLDLSILPKHRQEFRQIVESQIDKAIKSDVKIVVIDQLKLNTKSGRFRAKVLSSLSNTYKHQFQYIFVFSEDIVLNRQKYCTHNSFDILFQNIYYFPYATNSEIDSLISQNSTRFNYEISKTDSQLIAYLSGGCPWLIKNLFKRLVSNQSLVIDDDMLSWGQEILAYLKPEIILSLKNIPSAKSSIITSIKSLNLIDKDNVIRSQILAKALENYQPNAKLIISSDTKSISINPSTDISQITPSEKEIIFFLYSNHRISRENIAAICYGQNKPYSDYAIDKIMSRLRNKLISFGIPRDILKTQRGFGYMLNLTNA
jgi:hypothetical protein